MPTPSKPEINKVQTDQAVAPAAICSAWTQRKPTENGWWWFRHIVGAIPTDEPLHVMRMHGPAKVVNGEWQETWNDYLSVYYDGQWRNLDDFPTGPRYLWSNASIAKPNSQLNQPELA